MSEVMFPFQPGAMLHDAIMGAFRAQGGSFERWLDEQGIPPATARGATYGQSKGPKGRETLGRILGAAGPNVVRTLYIDRLNRHVAEVRAWKA
ncbi:hypothetical protein [Albidovulum sp.]|uniref:hypothetical protein n=1 Tax=Albidovulum sp. TaxID=1872424 RepID=UPI0039B944D5